MVRALLVVLMSVLYAVSGNFTYKTVLLGYSLDNLDFLSMGVFRKNGQIITSSDFFTRDNLKKDITIYVNDTPKNPPICFAKARIKAIDFDRNLALLEVERYLDVFCNEMPAETDYHRQFIEDNGIDFFCSSCKYFPPLATKLNYVTLGKEGYYEPKQSMNLGYFYKKNPKHAFVIGFETKEKPKYPGTPYFGEQGELYGLYAFGKFSDIGFDGVITKGMLTAFLCELEKSGIIKGTHPVCRQMVDEGIFGIILDNAN